MFFTKSVKLELPPSVHLTSWKQNFPNSVYCTDEANLKMTLKMGAACRGVIVRMLFQASLKNIWDLKLIASYVRLITCLLLHRSFGKIGWANTERYLGSYDKIHFDIQGFSELLVNTNLVAINIAFKGTLLQI